MLRVNKKLEYGILALLHLDETSEKTASVREISSSCGIPVALLSKIMQSMKSVGIVQAVHGNQGGYRLMRELSQVSLLDINQVLVGPVQVADCLEPSVKACPVKESCSIVVPMGRLNQKLIDLFSSTSLESLSPGRKQAV